jgi:hypothetical protein
MLHTLLNLTKTFNEVRDIVSYSQLEGKPLPMYEQPLISR